MALATVRRWLALAELLDQGEHRWLLLHPQSGFSGLTSSIEPPRGQHRRNLVFPNNELSRALEATKDKWIAIVDVFLFNPDNKSERIPLHKYDMVRSRLRRLG